MLKKNCKEVVPTRWRYLFVLIFVIGILFTPWIHADAEQILKPHILTTGTEEDMAKHTNYKFSTDGEERYKLVLEKDGCLQIRMYVKNAGFINTKIYKNADGSDLPDYLTCQCTSDLGNQGVIRQYMKKGTYYLCFPKNTYDIDLLLYSSAARTIKSGSLVAAYCNADLTNFFNYKATKTGYITIDQKRLVETAASMSVSLNTSKGTKLTDVISDHAIDKQIIFPVKKGQTYKIGIRTLNVDGHQYYQMKMAFHADSKHAGSKKSKAESIKLKKSQSGILFSEDSSAVADWYKITNTKKQKLNLVCSGFVTSGSIDISIYNQKGKLIGKYHILPGKGDKVKYQIKTSKNESSISKGIYYIKVSKSSKYTAGIYNVIVKP